MTVGASIAFLFSNPRHHAEILLPAARKLHQQGQNVSVLSLAELRGFETKISPELPHNVQTRVLPFRFRSPSAGAASANAGSDTRSLVKQVFWSTILAPRLAWLLRDVDLVVVPNDFAYPYAELVANLRAMSVPFVLVQEGIRFPVPSEGAGNRYGLGGAARVCAWGAGSAQHFADVGVPPRTLAVCGNPRFDHLVPAEWSDRGRSLLAELAVSEPPLLYLSNPIDDLGFCTTDEKLALFRAFCVEAAPTLARLGVPLVVKLHPREDLAAFQQAAAATGAAVTFAGDVALFALLAVARATIVLASTVGLEALFFGNSIGALAIPGAGYVFDYVPSGAAVGLAPGALEAGLTELLAPASAKRQAAAGALLEKHMAFRGTATDRLATTILEAVR